MNGTKNAGLDDHYPVERLRVTDCPGALTVAAIYPKVLARSEVRQRLALLYHHLYAIAFLMEGPTEMIARMCISAMFAARVHDKYLALPRAPDPQRQPKIRLVSDRHRVLLFTGNRREFHQPNL